MNTEQSIALIAAVAAVAYWYGKKQASKAAATASQLNSMEWLGGWANA